MENRNSSNALPLTAFCFNQVVSQALQKLGTDFPNIMEMGVNQIYGFGNYDNKLPSLKGELEKILHSFINGKYIYDKTREYKSGKPIIKLNRPYKSILFEYLGYQGLSDYVQAEITDAQEAKLQLSMITTKHKNETYYYISYHFGEYKAIVKAEVTVKDNWKRIEYRYVYPQDDGSIKEFLYYGSIKKRADALHIQTRTLLDGKMVEGGENILYIGYGDPAKSKFILGVYSAFDINNRLIAGKIIHEKCSSKEEMERLSVDEKIPAYIVQEIRNMRIENDINIPNDKLEISSKSPYYHTFEKIAGKFRFEFVSSEHSYTDLEIRIDGNTFKIRPINPGVLLNKDSIDLVNNGSILHFCFELTGLSSFLQLDIYIKSYYLQQSTDTILGVFSGVDFENRLVSGQTKIIFTPN